MEQYKAFLQAILDENKEAIEKNEPRKDRTGVGRYSLFGYQMRFPISKDAFPMVTTKRVSFRLIKSELKWFMRGQTNIQPLLMEGNPIWNEWAFERYIVSEDYKGSLKKENLNSKDKAIRKQIEKEIETFCERIINDDAFAEKHGDLGNIYGKQWRNIIGHDGEVIDQFGIVVNEIKENPMSTRLIVDSWTPQDIYTKREKEKLALPPCHMLYQFFVEDGKLSCHLFLRSNDAFLGAAYNITSYCLLTAVIAELLDLETGELVYTVSDGHIYANHLEQVYEQLSREPKPLPKLKLTVHSLEDWDAELIDYESHPAIKAEVAV